MKERLITLFKDHFGHRPEGILELAGDGSTRKYYRLLWGEDESVVGGIGPDHEENEAFLGFAGAFHKAGLPVPEIYTNDPKAGMWLEEDLGDVTLFERLKTARAGEGGIEMPADTEGLFRDALSILPRFQVLGHTVADYGLAYPRQAFDELSMRWDLNYFKYHFLKPANIPFNEQRLEDDFESLIDHLLQAHANFFMYRDFQSRNIMVHAGASRFIDFQGGRKGALQYDVASLLYDPPADIPPTVRDRLLEHYLDALNEYRKVDRTTFLDYYPGFVLIRLMQAMGAFGYRGFFERKRHFLESVPFAVSKLADLSASGLPVVMRELEIVFQRIVESWTQPESHDKTTSCLVVQILSFSFKNGYPPVEKGQEGFVFDCRSLPNPHDLPELRDLTGESAKVGEFLERSAGVLEFRENVLGLVKTQIEDYLNRDQPQLTVSFGCIGGRHRSVFLATKLADFLNNYNPRLDVRLLHREL